MLKNIEHVYELSAEYKISSEDILMIALNACGVKTSFGFSRLRIRLRMINRPDDEFRLIIAPGRNFSPFEIVDDILKLNGVSIATIREYEIDNAVIGYFRRNGTVITLNSNSRSHCTGCAFCPNTLEGASDPKVIKVEELISSLKILANSQNKHSLKHIKEVNLSTGCFLNEDRAIEHLLIVKEALIAMECEAQIGLLSSVIRSNEALYRIKKEIGDFHLILTIECFTNREFILKESKSSLTPNKMPAIFKYAKEIGIDTDFTYIIGLDDIEVACENFRQIAPFLTRFPNLQVYQPHNPLMDYYAVKEAKEITYYLNARKKIESIFITSKLRPLSWENYRPLWYFEFANEPLISIRS
jgi:hypothetical protein